MAITKRTFIEQVTLRLEDGGANWLEITVIAEDGVELARTGRVSAADVDQPVPAEVTAIRAPIVTQDKLDKVAEKRAKNNPKP